MEPLLHAGQSIGDSYEVERHLGEGAFAQVYRVRHRHFGRLAMKVFSRAGSAAETERMLAEAVLLSRLSHPNIVRVFDAGTVDTPAGRHGWFTTEYVAGGTLHDLRVAQPGRVLPVATAVRLLGQVCAGLAVAHGQRPPIVHRDLTPQNILVGPDSTGQDPTGPDPGSAELRARIADFGLATTADPVTHRVSAQGTLAFMPPEALRAGGSGSPAGDVFALGVIGYLLLTDALPYGEPDPGTGRPAAFAPPLPPGTLNVEVDDELDAILLGALDPDPHRRPADAAALRARLVHRTNRASPPGAGVPPVADRATRALDLAAAGQLREAADLMDQALRADPRLRGRHAHRVELWRKGVVA